MTWLIASVAESGSYLVYAKWLASPANASDAAYTVTDSSGAHNLQVVSAYKVKQYRALVGKRCGRVILFC